MYVVFMYVCRTWNQTVPTSFRTTGIYDKVDALAIKRSQVTGQPRFAEEVALTLNDEFDVVCNGSCCVLEAADVDPCIFLSYVSDNDLVTGDR